MTGHSIRRFSMLCLLGLAPLCGCATTPRVQLDRWQPVGFDVQGVDRLAVLRFSGKESVADAVRSQVLSELERDGFYTLVDEGTALRLGQNAAYLGPTEKLKLAVDEAGQMGINALLAARLTGRSERAGVVAGPFQSVEPNIVVELNYDLIHVPSGQLLATDTITRTVDGGLGDDAPAAAVVEEVARRLALECGSELVAHITAHPESFEVELAGSSWPSGGASEVSDGNQAAANGDWKAAMDHWHTALDEAPDNHAAMYNLGVAFEHFADHEGAVYWYGKAVNEKDKDEYRAALDRADEGRRGHHLAQVQIARQRAGYFHPSGSPFGDPRNLTRQPTYGPGLGYR